MCHTMRCLEIVLSLWTSSCQFQLLNIWCVHSALILERLTIKLTHFMLLGLLFGDVLGVEWSLIVCFLIHWHNTGTEWLKLGWRWNRWIRLFWESPHFRTVSMERVGVFHWTKNSWSIVFVFITRRWLNDWCSLEQNWISDVIILTFALFGVE